MSVLCFPQHLDIVLGHMFPFEEETLVFVKHGDYYNICIFDDGILKVLDDEQATFLKGNVFTVKDTQFVIVSNCQGCLVLRQYDASSPCKMENEQQQGEAVSDSNTPPVACAVVATATTAAIPAATTATAATTAAIPAATAATAATTAAIPAATAAIPAATAATADSNSEKTNHGFAVAVKEAQKPTATGSSDTKTNLTNADASGSRNQHKKHKKHNQQRQKHESQKPLNDEQNPNMQSAGMLEQILHELRDVITQFHKKYNCDSSNGAEQQFHGHRHSSNGAEQQRHGHRHSSRGAEQQRHGRRGRNSHGNG
jgi:Skp family chaperone for outer membrane proteins